jgi:mannose-1-phosphate guanylyltransferase
LIGLDTMEAIILAGGYGTRLRPLTYTKPKSLLPIHNKPMIWYLIEMLPQEVEKVILAVNYKKDMIEQYFKTNDCGRTVIVNNEPEPLGTGGATKFAEKHITGDFFVLNSDTISSLHLHEMMDFHTAKNAFATISLWPVENVSEFGVVDITADKKIVNFVEKPPVEKAPSDLINAGAYLLNHEVLDYIEKGRLISMEKEIFPQIITKTDRFYGFEFNGFWIDVGRIASYFQIHTHLLHEHQLNNVEGLNCSIHGELTKSALGNNTIVGSQSKITSSIIFEDVDIGKNVLIQNSIIGESSSIGDHAQLINTIIGGNETIKPKTKLQDKTIWTQPIPKGYPKKQIGNALKSK